MKTFQKCFSFIKKHLFGLKVILILLLSCGAISTAYLYGSTSNSVQIHANLMQVDYEINPSKTTKTNFLHGEISFDEVLTDKQKYDKSLEIMRRTLGRNKYCNTYLVSSYKGEPRQYQATTGIANLDWNNFSMCMVRNFWDTYRMENIAIPLFRNVSKNGIRPLNENAEFGAYISARTAYKFVSCNGMLEKHNNNIEAAFNELLDNTEYYFKINCETAPLYKADLTFSVNNIYLTEEYFYLLENKVGDDAQAKESVKLIHKSYRDYHKTFSKWNDETLITYSQNIFTSGFNFTFDICGSYFNYDYFIKNIIGSDYSENGLELKFIGKGQNLEKYSDEVNKYSVSKDSKNYIYLVVSILLFASMIFCFVFLFKDIKTKKSKFIRSLLYFLPFIPFLLCQLFVYIFLVLTTNFITTYLVFNYIGNTIIVLYALIGLIYSLLWSVIEDGKNKVSN